MSLPRGAATDSALAECGYDAVESDSPMPTLRTTYVFVLALILALPASATHAVTTPTPTVTPMACCGDCDGDGVVSNDEFQTCIPPIIPEAPFAPCSACDCNHDGNVGSAGELTRIATNILSGCPGAPTKTSSATPTETPSHTLTLMPTATSSPTLPPTLTPTPSPSVTTTSSRTATATTPSTPTPTATSTSTACAGEPARLNPVTSPTGLLQQTITGSGRPLEDAGGSHSIYVITPAGVFYAFSRFNDPLLHVRSHRKLGAGSERSHRLSDLGGVPGRAMHELRPQRESASDHCECSPQLNADSKALRRRLPQHRTGDRARASHHGQHRTRQRERIDVPRW